MLLRSPLAFSVALLMSYLSSSALSCVCQASKALQTGKIDVRVLQAIHEPEESRVSYVSISVTVRGAELPFIVPTCPESSDGNNICVASLIQANGKPIRVRKGLEAVLGVEDAKTWKPVRVTPGEAAEFDFAFDLGLLAARPGELVRLKFGIWPNAESMSDPNQATMIVTPVFRIPIKPE